MNGKQPKLRLAVTDAAGHIAAEVCGQGSVTLSTTRPWAQGDTIVLWSDVWPVQLRLTYDAAVPSALVWLTSDRFDFPVPWGEGRMPYAAGAFDGLSVLHAEAVEATGERRILSENPLDRRGETTCYPHCVASVETRDESIFAARNVIDGLCENTSHGEWPYTSWGDNENPVAEITVQFGRTVLVDEADILIRADFPHDNWWRSAVLVFSDGTREPIRLQKTGAKQKVKLTPRQVTWVKLTELEKDPDDLSPFPALSQIVFWGHEVQRES